MATKRVRGSKAAVQAAIAKADKTAGYPKRGTHVGGGKHVDLEDGRKRGWTLTTAKPVEDGDTWYADVPKALTVGTG